MKRWIRSLGCGAFTLVPALALASGPDATTPRIYGGEPTPSCGWPSTVSMSEGCTGTLVHPQVVIYAAHCGASQSSVRFGEAVTSSARIVPTTRCVINPAYTGDGSLGDGVDHAYCLLSEPQLDVPIVPILMGCETDALVGGTPVTIVGFGEREGGQSGVKYQAVTTLSSVGATNEAFVGGQGVDTCFGDSGGPVYIQLPDQGTGVGQPDGTWRVFGITSYGSAGCGAGGYYSMMHVAMPWFESELAPEGIDLTPCHDADGTWNPSDDCVGFPQQADVFGGSWATGCDPGPRGALSAICGAPFTSDPDDGEPTVAFVTPMDQERFETGGAPDVAIAIDVDASDAGWGMRSVALLIDGAEIAVDNVAPYAWSSVAFPPGQFTISALATDFAGNTATAEVNIGVDMDAIPRPEVDDEDGGTSESDDGPGALEEAKGCGCSFGARSSGAPTVALAGLGLFAWRRRRVRSRLAGR